MEAASNIKNPTQLFLAFFDSFNEPMCIIDEEDNIIMNQPAKDLQSTGMRLDLQVKKIKKGCSGIVTHKSIKYRVDKKDINHGTNSCLCTVKQEDETISRLKESSTKLKKVLNSL